MRRVGILIVVWVVSACAVDQAVVTTADPGSSSTTEAVVTTLDVLSEVERLQDLLDEARDRPEGHAIRLGLLKSLKRAVYREEPLGHYGLSKADYCHFTSPIRRYADLVVHRCLFTDRPEPGPALEDIANHVSATERTSAEAERDSRHVKLHAFLQSQLKLDPVCYHVMTGKINNYQTKLLLFIFLFYFFSSYLNLYTFA